MRLGELQVGQVVCIARFPESWPVGRYGRVSLIQSDQAWPVVVAIRGPGGRQPTPAPFAPEELDPATEDDLAYQEATDVLAS